MSVPYLLGGTFLSEDISQRSREDSTSQRSGIDAGKDGIEAVTFRHPRRGFYSRLFLVRKKMGDWRPVIDLSRLNRFISDCSFQNGNFEFSSSCLTEKRLGHLTGSERCVLPHTHPSKVKEISLFPFYGDNVPVPGVSLRSCPSPLCLYSCSQDGGQVLPLPRAASPCLFE